MLRGLKPATDNNTPAKPTFREVAPRWAALSDRLFQLVELEESTLDEIAELERTNNERIPGNLAPAPLPPLPQPKPMRTGVRDLLGPLAPERTEQPEQAAGVVVQGPRFSSEYARRSFELSSRVDAVREAQRLIREELPRALAEGSRRYAELHRADYQKHVDGVCGSLIALAQAVSRYRAFIQEVFVTAGASPVPLGLLEPDYLNGVVGDQTDSWSPFRTFIVDAAERARFDLGKMPADLIALRTPAPRAPSPFDNRRPRSTVRRVVVKRRRTKPADDAGLAA